MNPTLRIFFIVCIVLFFFIILYYLIKKKLNLKYTLIWLFSVLVLLILAIFPILVEKVASLVGIVDIPNTVFVFLIIFLVAIVFTLTAIVSGLNNSVRRLTQHQALMEKKIRELEGENAPEAPRSNGQPDEKPSETKGE